MILGRVKGCVVSTVKHPSYDGKKVMLVEPVTRMAPPKKGRWWLSTRWAPGKATSSLWLRKEDRQ